MKTYDSMTGLTLNESDTLEATIARLVEPRRADGGPKGLTLTSREQAAVKKMAHALAVERVRQTTGIRIFKVHFHEGRVTELEFVQEISERHRLT